MNDNVDFLMLKAEVAALRNAFLGFVKAMSDSESDLESDSESDSESYVWLNRFLLWKFERENLAECRTHMRTSQSIEKISRRRHLLQILCDIAFLEGELEYCGEVRKLSELDREIAADVFLNSDGTEDSLIREAERFL